MIIRSSNERTEELCRKLILEQGISIRDLFIVREVPFTASMRTSFNIGIEQQKKWTLCIDADLLLRPNSINNMICHADRQHENVSGIQGLVMDKFFGGPRDAGNHLYRTSLLPMVMNFIPEQEDYIRPETHVLNQMSENGHPWLKVPYVVGLHDSYQYYSDIYRKCFIQGVKHVNRLPLFVNYWREKRDDPDYLVALKALSHSIANTEPVFINAKQSIFKEGFKRLNIQEKEPLLIDDISLEAIEKMIASWKSPKIYYQFFPTSSGLDKPTLSLVGKLKAILKKYGFMKSLIYFTRRLYKR